VAIAASAGFVPVSRRVIASPDRQRR